MNKDSGGKRKRPTTKQSVKTKTPQRDLTNRDLTLYALHLVGGDASHVPTEDVAVRAYELYPERFGIIRYPQYPDVEVVRMALIHMRVDKNQKLVEGDQRKGWRVTDEGLSWLADNRKAIEQALANKHPKERRIAKGKVITRGKIRDAYLKRLIESDAYAKWRKGIKPSVTDFYDLMRVDQYTPESTYQKRLSEMADAVGDSPDFVKFLRLLDRWFGQTYRNGGRDVGKRPDIRDK